LKGQNIDKFDMFWNSEEITAQEIRKRAGCILRVVKLFPLIGKETDFRLEVLLLGAWLANQPQ